MIKLKIKKQPNQLIIACSLNYKIELKKGYLSARL